MDVLAQLAPRLRDTRFAAEMIPGHRREVGLDEGSNCQRYAYAVLAAFGVDVPPFRSDDLWADVSVTRQVTVPEPLDLVLYGPSDDPFGAHVGVCLGGTKVLHLCEEIGTPIVWDFEDFAARPRYRSQIGFKRSLALPTAPRVR